MKVAILIDYDNLLPLQKQSGVVDIATKILMKLPKQTVNVRGTCDIRLYGGWYEGEQMSKLAQDTSVRIQEDFPAIIRLPSASEHGVALITNAELAVALVAEPSHHLFNTFRRKGRPNNIRVETPASVGCNDSTCPLQSAKKLLQTGKCSNNGCTRNDLIYRHEQKIVDTMLTCDLIYIAEIEYDYIILVSDDDDFLPPVRTVLLRDRTIYRVHPKINNQRTPVKITAGKLVELEL